MRTKQKKQKSKSKISKSGKYSVEDINKRYSKNKCDEDDQSLECDSSRLDLIQKTLEIVKEKGHMNAVDIVHAVEHSFGDSGTTCSVCERYGLGIYAPQDDPIYKCLVAIRDDNFIDENVFLTRNEFSKKYPDLGEEYYEYRCILKMIDV